MMKTKTREELACEYGISRTTLYRRLKKANIKLLSAGLITPMELEKIYSVFGKPTEIT